MLVGKTIKSNEVYYLNKIYIKKEMEERNYYIIKFLSSLTKYKKFLILLKLKFNNSLKTNDQKW